jgi:hypothetical protein
MPFLHYLFEYATKRRQIRAMTRRKFSGEVLGTEEAGGPAGGFTSLHNTCYRTLHRYWPGLFGKGEPQRLKPILSPDWHDFKSFPTWSRTYFACAVSSLRNLAALL